MTTKIITRDLPTTPHVGDFRLHCAALEWSLAEPIVIHSAEDIKSRVDWKDRVEPYRHQVENLMRFCRRLPVTLLADDVGLGTRLACSSVDRSRSHTLPIGAAPGYAPPQCGPAG
ncbi:MAG: hypothetical protein ACKO9B_13035 [Planctomycetota bacterium]